MRPAGVWRVLLLNEGPWIHAIKMKSGCVRRPWCHWPPLIGSQAQVDQFFKARRAAPGGSKVAGAGRPVPHAHLQPPTKSASSSAAPCATRIRHGLASPNTVCRSSGCATGVEDWRRRVGARTRGTYADQRRSNEGAGSCGSEARCGRAQAATDAAARRRPAHGNAQRVRPHAGA
jgi:hypothetical protein